MALFFEVLEDDQVRATYKIRSGLKIGRTKGEILLNDSKVSGLHAFIEKNERDQYLMIDNNSSNGIRVNQRRIAKALLLPGVVVQIGKAQLRVVEMASEEYAPENVDWKDALQKLLGENRQNFEVSNVEAIRPLTPAVRLHFVEGLHLNAQYTLGFGPRVCGAASLDLPIYEVDIPEEAFHITPGEGNHPHFRTDHPKQVRYNNRELESVKIKSGDIIQLGKSKIKIETIDE